MSLLAGVRRVLFVHAHPDDESLATGVLIAQLQGLGVRSAVVTATRGEQGELVPGAVPHGTSGAALSAHRERELAGALDALGVSQHYWLGTSPARAPGLAQRRYLDSGMRWVTPSVAGPAESADALALTRADEREVVADLRALLDHDRPDVVVTYDEHGGYGHPDHIRLHQATRAACGQLGIRLLEVIPPGRAPDRQPGVEWVDRPDLLPVVVAALRQHASQLTVHGSEVEHVGGQREAVLTRLGLREVAAP